VGNHRYVTLVNLPGSRPVYAGGGCDLNAKEKPMKTHTPQVGAPDPERKTSPIFDEDEAEEPSLDIELETGVCYFNDAPYPIGQYVRSGNELLHCEERGVWVRKGELRPDPAAS
jgi:hypothetical protein